MRSGCKWVNTVEQSLAKCAFFKLLLLMTPKSMLCNSGKNRLNIFWNHIIAIVNIGPSFGCPEQSPTGTRREGLWITTFFTTLVNQVQYIGQHGITTSKVSNRLLMFKQTLNTDTRRQGRFVSVAAWLFLLPTTDSLTICASEIDRVVILAMDTFRFGDWDSE